MIFPMYYCVRKRAICRRICAALKKKLLYMGTAMCMFLQIEKFRKYHIYLFIY